MMYYEIVLKSCEETSKYYADEPMYKIKMGFQNQFLSITSQRHGEISSPGSETLSSFKGHFNMQAATICLLVNDAPKSGGTLCIRVGIQKDSYANTLQKESGSMKIMLGG